jgi:hypothetical protein
MFEVTLAAMIPLMSNMTLAHIKKNGLEIGDRWMIREENTTLVFRDLIGSETSESRYVMEPDVQVNL